MGYGSYSFTAHRALADQLDRVEEEHIAFRIAIVRECLEGGEQCLDAVHVGIHPPIRGKHRPVLSELVLQQPTLIIPEPTVDHIADVVDEPIGIWMPGHPCTRAGKKYKYVTIREFCPVRGRLIPHRPEIAAIIWIPVASPEKAHTGVNHVGAAGCTEYGPKRV